MTILREAAQQALDSINELFAAEQSEGGERGGHIRTPATREHLVRVAQARRALHESCDTLRAALAQQVEPQGCATEEDCTKQPWCRIRGECQRKQAEPLNLSDPAVQKRLATQWGYVPAAQAEPVEPVAWYRPSIAPDYYAPVFVEGAQPPAPLTQAEARLLGWRPLVPPQQAEPVGQLAELQAMLRAEVDRLIAAGIQPQRKPLTLEEIYHATGHCGVSKYTAVNITRAVERAHGIKE